MQEVFYIKQTMKKLILLLTVTITTVFGQKADNVLNPMMPQVFCPPGQEWIVRIDSNPSHSMPIQRCMDTEEWEASKKKSKKPREPKTPKEDKSATVLKILKYGSPHAIGQSFPSLSQCEEEKARLNKANAGLDYSYKCVKK